MQSGWSPEMVPPSGRMSPESRNKSRRLGTETAFAVSAEAAAFAAAGNDMYPFHLGDLNLPTPSNIVEASLKAIKDGKTGRTAPAQASRRSAALAADVNASHDTAYSAGTSPSNRAANPSLGSSCRSL